MKRIVIIGASSGIGARVAVDFAAAGWRVGIAARRTDCLKEIKDLYPKQLEYLEIDVTAQDAVEKFYNLIELIDGMDILLYAAGVGFCDPELDLEKLNSTLQTNVVGYARILAAAYKYYRSTANLHTGQIAAITSVAGTRGIGISAAYSSSKRFQQMFMDSLEQLAYTQRVNVCFTDIRPGFIRTGLLDENRDYPMIMSIDYVCPKIERAILRRKRRAVIDSRWRVVVGLWRLIPRCLWKRINLRF